MVLVGAALEELAVTLEEVVAGRAPPQAGDRRSLACDVELALTRVGRHLDQATSPSLKRVRTREVAKLASVFVDRTECARVAALTRALLAQLDSADALGAGWEDMMAAMGDDSAPVSACVLAFDQLKELVRLRGLDWRVVESRLHEPIRVGDVDAARAVVLEPPRDDAAVVWLVFANADLRSPMVRVGPVQFFNGWLDLNDLPEGRLAVDNPDFEPASELTERAIEWLNDIESEPIVYARVELGGKRAKRPPTGRRVPPMQWARQLAADLVDAVAFRHGGTEWVLLDRGYYFTAGGSGWSSPSWSGPVEFPLPEAPAQYEPTGKALAQLSSGFVDALVAEDKTALDAMEAISWHGEVAKLANPDMRVALHVRRFEVQWSTRDAAGWQTWEAPLRHYLRDVWCRDQQNDALSWAGRILFHSQLAGSPHDAVHVAAHEVLERLGDRTFRINLKAMMRLAPEVAGGFHGGTFERRYFKELARETRDGAAAQLWWMELRKSFDVLLNRAVRQRNRVIHGRAPVAEVISTIDSFISWCSAYLAASGVDATAARRTLDATLEDERKDLADLFERLGDEASVSGLFSYRVGHPFYELFVTRSQNSSNQTRRGVSPETAYALAQSQHK